MRTLGALALLDDGRPVAGAMSQRRRLALLAMLAASDGMARERLVGCLWPEQEEARARHTLSQWLHLLRRDLPPGAVTGTDELRLDPSVLPSDVAEFREALARGDLAAAVAAYGGPFADGFSVPDAPGFDRWADGERECLRRLWRDAARRLAEQDGSPESWRRLAADDPADAAATLGLMRALEREGDRAAAIGHARVHARLLADEYELPPDGAVEAYAAELRAAPPRTPAVAPVAIPVDAPAVAPLVAPLVASAAEPDRPGVARRRPWRWPAAALLLLAAAAAAWMAALPEARRAQLLALVTRDALAAEPRRVVVAPLENRTGDPSLDAFGELVADLTAGELAGAGELDVVDARTASLTARVVEGMPRLLRDGDRAVALARETGAATVITGRYYADGDTVRVHAQVVDAASGKLRRALGAVGGARDDLQGLATRVGRRAAALVAASVDTSAAGAGVGRAPPMSYDGYRETSAAWERYYRSDFEGAFAHTARAIALDSTYMVPRLMRGVFHAERREWAGLDSTLRAVAPHAAALSGLERSAYAMLRAQLAADAAEALRAERELARSAPASPESHAHLAHVAVAGVPTPEALAALAPLAPDRGVLLVVPFYWNWTTAALHALGRHDEELAAARRGVRQFPTRNVTLLNMARALGPVGDAEGVRALARRARDERWDGEAVRRRVLVEGAWELRAHGHAAPAAALRAKSEAKRS
ncbi:BTAD domain-containing putative transcriptional regulator [Roseisolibacter sp. H3M3-2]|uniref:BTAD domain-containing putative transcriptional regulator n=1 Tax=Roseisolibacter sp. H3M3-2 TaxID=3031323 RepID=UPI0023D9EAA8|nr:BTAD domain-containing putative transcriptional regulator [Roseisolibacter sp. H3M3-2]MDF1504898.1 BTAD domain-containing putative transcriptional regulator [Roseisolibacter sp. H3M3-2]